MTNEHPQTDVRTGDTTTGPPSDGGSKRADAASSSSHPKGGLPSEATEALLGIKKGSRVGPILLIVAMVVIFVVHNLPAGLEQLAANLGMTPDPLSPVTFQTVTEAFLVEDKWATTKTVIGGYGPADMFTKLGLPLFKAYLDQLIVNFLDIMSTTINTVWQLGLYAIIPGLAGLIYRRNFWAWFLLSLLTLFAVNASGVFGSLASAEQMPLSGTIFVFLATQLIILLLANRLRRYSSSVHAVPPRVYNAILAAILVAIAVACATGVGPWVDAGTQTSWIWSFFGGGVTGWIYKWELILIGLPLLYILLRSSVHWAGRTRKNIVLCLDGTSNTPDQHELGLLAQTNVFKLFKLLKSDAPGSLGASAKFDATLTKRYGGKQIAFYYSGVGNKFDNDPIAQTLGLAAGMGAAGLVERAYLDLMRVFQPGDRVCIFGFSRGAAIARLLARAIDARGAPRTVWTMRLFGRHWTVWSSARRQRVPIAVLGCWDTVGAFGIAKTFLGINFQQMNLFKDLTVPDNVEQAYHMLALDEMRDAFEPTLMEADPVTPERIIEVWFSGDHANVGGGWATDKLSDVTLDFLLRHVSSGYATDASSEPGNEAWGLYLAAANGERVVSEDGDGMAVPVIRPDALGQLRSWASRLYTYRPRQLPLDAVISESVFERMTKASPVYAPLSLFEHNEALDQRRDRIEAEAGKLIETKSISAEECQAILAHKDMLRLTRWPQRLESLRRSHVLAPPEQRLSNAVEVV